MPGRDLTEAEITRATTEVPASAALLVGPDLEQEAADLLANAANVVVQQLAIMVDPARPGEWGIAGLPGISSA
jgi:hypothetical protein